MSMKKASLFGRWLWQAWPVWIVLLLIGLNICAYRLLQYDWDSVHRVAGAILQVMGGAFVLYFLNKNMGVFKKANFRKRIAEWWAFRPFRKIRDTILQVDDINHGHSLGTPALTPEKKAVTLEERIDVLEKRTEDYHQEMRANDDELQKNIESVKQEMRSGRSEDHKKIAEVESLVAQVVVGGANSQFFGILLVLYGTLLPVL